jgi:transposase
MLASICTRRDSAFVAAVDTAERFDNAYQVESYFGLVPSESSSGKSWAREPSLS